MNSPLNITVSCFKDSEATAPKTVNLMTWLTSAKYKDQVDKIRAIPNKKERDALKKKLLPGITPSGLFSYRADKCLITHSRLMAFDIDLTGNEHITNYTELKGHIKNVNNVAYCGLSVSGQGFWGLIPIAYPEQHKSQFKALEIAFKKWGIKIDNTCSNLSRLRYYSYDNEGYFNHNAEVFTGLYTEPVKPQPTTQAQGNITKPLEIAVKLIQNAQDGQKWKALTKAAYLLGGYIGGGEVTENEARQTLQSAISVKANVSDLNAAFRTIDKGLKDGQNKPIYQPVTIETPQNKSTQLTVNNDFLKQSTNNGLKLTADQAKDFISFCDTLK